MHYMHKFPDQRRLAVVPHHSSHALRHKDDAAQRSPMQKWSPDLGVGAAITKWLDQAVGGHCAWPTDDGDKNDCSHGRHGWLKLGGGIRNSSSPETWRKAAAGCLRRCASCERCRTVSISVSQRACVWFHDCTEMRPNNLTGAEDFRSAPVRNATLDPASFLCDRPFVTGSTQLIEPNVRPGQKNDGAVARMLGASQPAGRDVPAENLCARLGEQVAFQQLCGGVYRTMDRMLQETRYKRGLVIDHPGPTLLGIGHLLSAAMAYHFVCWKLRRYCYIQLHGAELEASFGYANGMHWMPHRKELSRYPRGGTKSVDLRKMRPTRGPSSRLEYSKESTIVKLIKGLEGETAPLIYVKVPHEWGTGRLPLVQVGDNWLPFSLPLRRTGSSTCAGESSQSTTSCDDDEVTGVDRCFYRFVTQPRFNASASLDDERAIAAMPHGVHLRTGYADVEDVDLRQPTFSGGVVAHPGRLEWQRQRLWGWLRLACSELLRPGSPPSFVVSDSPGVLQYLRDSFGARVRTSDSLPRLVGSGVSSRTWLANSGAKRAVAQDICALGLVSEIHAWSRSSFVRPVVARSVCTRKVTELSDNVCPRFKQIFSRDLYMHLWHSTTTWYQDLSKATCLLRQLPSDHPCKNASIRGCIADFIVATRPPLVEGQGVVAPAPTSKQAAKSDRRRRQSTKQIKQTVVEAKGAGGARAF